MFTCLSQSLLQLSSCIKSFTGPRLNKSSCSCFRTEDTKINISKVVIRIYMEIPLLGFTMPNFTRLPPLAIPGSLQSLSLT